MCTLSTKHINIVESEETNNNTAAFFSRPEGKSSCSDSHTSKNYADVEPNETDAFRY